MADCCRKIVIVETSGDDKSAKTIVRGIITEEKNDDRYRKIYQRRLDEYEQQLLSYSRCP